MNIQAILTALTENLEKAFHTFTESNGIEQFITTQLEKDFKVVLLNKSETVYGHNGDEGRLKLFFQLTQNGQNIFVQTSSNYDFVQEYCSLDYTVYTQEDFNAIKCNLLNELNNPEHLIGSLLNHSLISNNALIK